MSIPPSARILTLPATITIAKTTFTANSQSLFVFGIQTLSLGQQVTYSQTVLSLASNGHSLVIDGTSMIYPKPSYLVGTETITAGSPALTDSGVIYSVASNGALSVDNSTQAVEATTQIFNADIQQVWVPGYIVGSQTLIADGLPITSSGTVLSLESDGGNIVFVISKTEDIKVWLGSSPSSRITTEQMRSSNPDVNQNQADSTLSKAPGSTRMAAGTRNNALVVIPNFYALFLSMVAAFVRI